VNGEGEPRKQTALSFEEMEMAIEAIRPQDSKAVKKLIEIGILPPDCTRFELVIDANAAIRAKCEFFVSEESLQEIATAFEENPEEARRILTSSIVTARTDYCVGKAETDNIPRLIFGDPRDNAK
jgi:hypothetical protein